MSSDLPETIALFPLMGTILLPGNILPLHIFEPRYRQMVENCIEERPYIGMIQPVSMKTEELYKIGCLGQIEHFRQLPNGNYLIRLQGEVRFQIEEELQTETLYRIAKVAYSHFLHDLREETAVLKKKPLYEAFKHYLEQRNLRIDWDKVEKIPVHQLVNVLSMNLEFNFLEKQTLLESHDVSTRFEDLIALLEMAYLPGMEGNIGTIN